MPNWVKNIVRIEGPAEDIAKAIELMRDKDPKYHDTHIDFNNIISMPDRLNIVAGGYDRHYVALYLRSLSYKEQGELQSKLSEVPLSYYGNYLKKYAESFMMDISEGDLRRMAERFEEDYRDIRPNSMEDVGKAYIDNILEYGADAWYDWSRDNWGTKWNPRECVIGDDYLEFETAWSAPFPIIAALSQRFPELIFCHEWVDENLGCNCGRREFRNGLVVAAYHPCNAEYEEAHKFSCEIWGYDPTEYDEDDLQW